MGTWDDIWAAVKKGWNFLWNDNSPLSWALNILLAFVLIKFILYPGIGLLLGTNLPVVAVISESMEHDGDFDKWWNSNALCTYGDSDSTCRQHEWYNLKGITREQFEAFSMKDGFNKGDIIILKGAKFDDVQVGEVIVFQSKLEYPIIHRVVSKNDVIETKGDHNQKQIADAKLNEKYITKDQIIGRAWLRIPYIGYVKILFVQLLQCVAMQGCSFG